MDLHALSVFLAVARRSSFSKAAADLRLSQSAVSQQVAGLEKSLGVRLFERLGRTTHLTEAGETLRPEAERLLSQADRAREAVRHAAGLDRGTVRVGASTTPGVYLLPEAIAQFRARHPGVDVELRVAPSAEVERLVLVNEVDLGFVGAPPRDAALRARAFGEDRIAAFCAASHPLARAARVSAAEFLAAPLVLRPKGSATRALFDRWAARRPGTVRPAMEFDAPEAVKRVVAAGLGVSALSAYALRQEVEAGLVRILPVGGFPLRRRLHLVVHRDKHVSRAQREFLEEAVAWRDRVDASSPPRRRR